MADDNWTELPTFTHLWKVDGVLYTLGDWVLPFPLNIKSAAVAVGVFAPQAFILFKLGLFGSVGVFSLVLSGFLGWAADKPAFGGRTISQVVIDHWEFIMAKKRSYDLVEDSDLGESRLDGEVFVPEDDDMVSGL